MHCLFQAARSPVHHVCWHNGLGKINTRSPIVFKSVTDFTHIACAPFTKFQAVIPERQSSSVYGVFQNDTESANHVTYVHGK
jgi:hypothetical protein